MVEHDSRNYPRDPSIASTPPCPTRSRLFVHRPPIHPPQCAVHPHANRLSNNYRKYTRGRLAALFFLSRSVLCLADIRLTLWALPICRSKYRRVIWSFFTRHCLIPFDLACLPKAACTSVNDISNDLCIFDNALIHMYMLIVKQFHVYLRLRLIKHFELEKITDFLNSIFHAFMWLLALKL